MKLNFFLCLGISRLSLLWMIKQKTGNIYQGRISKKVFLSFVTGKWKQNQWNQITAQDKFFPHNCYSKHLQKASSSLSNQMQHFNSEMRHLHLESAKWEAKGQNEWCDQLYLHKRENAKWFFQANIVKGDLNIYREPLSQLPTSANGKILCRSAPHLPSIYTDLP